tara:strand:+ start:1504 stop:1695 length:192 start_codon:yes stop_codon:yes gene_type:complete
MFYVSSLLAWWWVVANPHHTCNTWGNHPRHFLLCLLSRDKSGIGATSASVDGHYKTFLLVGRI